MYLVPKFDIFDSDVIDKDKIKRKIFTKGQEYFIEDCYFYVGNKMYIVTDDTGDRNYISQDGEFLEQFLIG